MEQQYIHVKVGFTNAVYPVRKFISDGPMHDMYEYQKDEHTIGWVHKRWCKPVTPQQSDTDWRGFLKSHWDNAHGYLSTDSLEGFMTVFIRAAANYINKQHEQETQRMEGLHKYGTHDKGRSDALSDPPGRHGNIAAVSGRDKAEVRKTGKPVKPVQLSLFPDF